MNTVKRSSAYLDLNWNHPLDQWPILHPSIPKSSTLKFWGTDSKELFEKNLKDAPKDWMYRNIDITYNFNSHGLRQKKEIHEINENNYILSLGGCINLGVGINEEDRYADIVSNKLKMDLITWGSPLGSLKYQTINFMNFIRENRIMPKILIAYHAPYNNTIFRSQEEFLLYTEDILCADPEKFPHHLAAYKELLKSDYGIQEGYLWRHIMKTICEKLKIKFIDISFFSDDLFVVDSKTLSVDITKKMYDINYTWARDFKSEAVNGTPYASHAGIGLHKDMANLILQNV
jgi:hypothetical protein